jgi:hypothetical protein
MSGNPDRARVEPGRDQAGRMGDVGHEIRADAVRDLAEALPVDRQRIGGRPGDNELRLVAFCEVLDLLVVDLFAFVEAVVEGLVQPAREVDGRTVREVSAVSERHAENHIARLQHRVVDRLVRLRAGVRLDIRVVGVKQLLRALDRELLGNVDVFAPPVVPLAGVAFGVLVRQHRALRREHRRARVVLGGDQLDVVLLAEDLAAHRLPQLRIGLREGIVREHVGAALACSQGTRDG